MQCCRQFERRHRLVADSGTAYSAAFLCLLEDSRLAGSVTQADDCPD